MLTDDQRKMLTEKLLREYVPKDLVEREYWEPPRTFLTAQDLMDCKEALEKKGLWEKFWNEHYDPLYCAADLFRTTDEQGNPHFCRLVAEFMEGKGRREGNEQ